MTPGAPADQFAAHVEWRGAEPMLPERAYGIRLSAGDAVAQVTDLGYRIDTESGDRLAAKTLRRGEAGYCKIALDRPVVFDAFEDNPDMGSFTLVDRESGEAVGTGTIDFALWRASNVVWHEMKIDKAVRARANGQKPSVLWFTGLSGSGKSSVADRLDQLLHAAGKRTYLLDGDNIRHGLCRDLGFTDHDRVENIRRVAEVARLMADAGLIVLVSFISPFRSERQMARTMMDDGEFIEIFVDAPLEVCEARDPKGLYKKARAGEVRNFTGIDSDYEPPEKADIVLNSADKDVEALARQVMDYLKENGRL